MATSTRQPDVSNADGSARYEYEVIGAPTSFWWFRMKKEETEALLNDLAGEGWQLDEAVVNWWGGAELMLRRAR